MLRAARELRAKLTDAEQLLWQCLRRRQLAEFRFRRQHPVERYVLDFYCCTAKVAFELDGGQHTDPEARIYDSERTAFLEQQGIRVIRFWNSEVFANIEGVLEQIYQAVLERCTLPSPPPPGEGDL